MPQEITKPTPLLKEDGSDQGMGPVHRGKPGLRRYLEHRGFR